MLLRSHFYLASAFFLSSAVEPSREGGRIGVGATLGGSASGCFSTRVKANVPQIHFIMRCGNDFRRRGLIYVAPAPVRHELIRPTRIAGGGADRATGRAIRTASAGAACGGVTRVCYVSALVVRDNWLGRWTKRSRL